MKRIFPAAYGIYSFSAADEAIRAHYPKMRSMLIARGGTILSEHYYGGCGPSSLHDLRSATKSVLSILLGIAAAQSALPELDEPVWDSVREYAPKRPDPAWSELTMRELLTMTSGLYWQTGAKLGERFIGRLHRSRKWADFILRLPVVEKQRGSFVYCSAGSHLLSVLLTKWTGMNASEFASTYLFKPLGMSDYRWDSSPEGHSAGHIGLYLTSRDMLKLGLLCLQKGRWEGEVLVCPEWLEKSMSPHCAPFGSYGQYGFHWWSANYRGLRYCYAHGHGGQQIHVIPELDAVVVFTGESKVKRFKNPKALLENIIIPGLQNT